MTRQPGKDGAVIRVLYNLASRRIAVRTEDFTIGAVPFWVIIGSNGQTMCALKPHELGEGWVELQVGGL